MTASMTNDGNYIEMDVRPAADADVRGRKRYRSPTRHDIRAPRTEKSNTLRGRSSHRAISPRAPQTRSRAPSRAHSPALNPLNELQLAFGAREREACRGHCPSRPSSVYPAEASRRRRRTKSRKSLALVEPEQTSNGSAA